MARGSILVIEDEPGIAMTLEDRLSAEGYEVMVCTDGISGESRAMDGGFDLILLDLMLPGRDGLAVCQNLRNQGSTVPILMLTARNTNFDVVIGLRQGADDYLAKPFDSGVLLARIEALLRRRALRNGPAIGPGRVSFGKFILDRGKGEVLEDNKPLSLNALEFRLLDFLVQRAGSVVSRNAILDEVWGYEAETATRTIDVHVAKLRAHLGESENPKHLITIHGRGYKFIK